MKTPQQALVKMRTEPRRYFDIYPTVVFGNPGPSGPYQFNISYHVDGLTNQHRGKYLGRLNRHRTPTFEITNGAGGHGAANFQAYWIETTAENNMGAVGALAGFNLPDPPAHNYMLTTQLSGCSFIIEPDPAGGINVMHINPNRGNAAGLRTNLMNNGLFAGPLALGPGPTVFGSHGGGGGWGYHHDGERITIVGVYHNSWSFWAQSHQIFPLRIDRGAIRLWP